MIKKISLENFKCFAEKKDLKMSRVSLLYGHNGRGKSSVSQALLLIGQSMKKQHRLRLREADMKQEVGLPQQSN